MIKFFSWLVFICLQHRYINSLEVLRIIKLFIFSVVLILIWICEAVNIYTNFESLHNKLLLGNLDAKRDWGYAPDYVDGMWRMLQQQKPDDFVLSTGKNYSVRHFINLVFNTCLLYTSPSPRDS